MSKERLDNIIEFEHTTPKGRHYVGFKSKEDYERFIQEAKEKIQLEERVKELEKENRELNNEIGYYSEQVYSLSHSIGANVADLKILSTRMLKGDTP